MLELLDQWYLKISSLNNPLKIKAASSVSWEEIWGHGDSLTKAHLKISERWQTAEFETELLFVHIKNIVGFLAI